MYLDNNSLTANPAVILVNYFCDLQCGSCFGQVPMKVADGNQALRGWKPCLGLFLFDDNRRSFIQLGEGSIQRRIWIDGRWGRFTEDLASNSVVYESVHK